MDAINAMNACHPNPKNLVTGSIKIPIDNSYFLRETLAVIFYY
jgi:hypothetical protein